MTAVSDAGRRIALLTRHGKERVIAPVLEPALGCNVERVTGAARSAPGDDKRTRVQGGNLTGSNWSRQGGC